MAFVKKGERDAKPDWVALSNWGIFGCDKASAPSDLHFHDCDEYWLIIQGKAVVRCDDEDQVMEVGDLLCAKMGEQHQIVEVLSDEPFRGVYLEGPMRGKMRGGHLHAGKHPLPTADEIAAT
ncbi:MAG: cupin domain-containing protein [Candidatus Poribacteria bacterium]|nr:cupin domain-containing protein [Candidatus Poribacteria bacterium]